MGMGWYLRCPQCKKEYRVATGIGFLFPDVYQEVIEKVRGEIYGKKLKLAIESAPFAAADAEVYLYVCQCGWWKTDYGLSVYRPKNLESLLQTEYGEKTVLEWGYVPYVCRSDLAEDYSLLYRHYHFCEKCHRRMKREPLFTDMKMCCKECGAVLNDTDDPMVFHWD